MCICTSRHTKAVLNLNQKEYCLGLSYIVLKLWMDYYLKLLLTLTILYTRDLLYLKVESWNLTVGVLNYYNIRSENSVIYICRSYVNLVSLIFTFHCFGKGYIISNLATYLAH